MNKTTLPSCKISFLDPGCIEVKTSSRVERWGQPLFGSEFEMEVKNGQGLVFGVSGGSCAMLDIFGVGAR